MKAPDKIYVPQHNIEAGSIQELDELIVAGSIEYIRKDALWKPTDEQMKALNAICCIGELSYVGQEAELVRLYQELKKL